MQHRLRTTIAGIGLAGALALTIALGSPAPARAAPVRSQPALSSAQAPAMINVRALPGRPLARALLRATATATGAEQKAVRDALRAGQSLAEFAAANGSSGDAVVQSVVAKARTRLDKAVENGRITRERADALLQKLAERATALVNKKRG